MVTTKSGLTYQVGQLSNAGLVVRATCPSDDRRGVNAEITPAGLVAVEQAAPHVEALARAHLLDLLPSGQLAELCSALTLVRDRLRQDIDGCCEH
jgi:DNA-binding MarR family transcriptional regulator